MLILRRFTVLALFVVACAGAVEREDSEVFQTRRQQLAAEHSDGVLVLFGYGEQEGFVTRSAFRQENNFYYLTGHNEPDATLLLLPGTGERLYREILFLPERDSKRELWSGPRIGPSDPDAAEKTGFLEVRPNTAWRSQAREALKTYRRIYSLLPQAASYGHLPAPDSKKKLGELASGIELHDVHNSLARMRMIKSAGELQLIQKAVDATVAAHLAAWTDIQGGLFEYQISGLMLGRMIDRGCLRAAYPPIVGAGPNAAILHYVSNSKRLRQGEVILIDVGGEFGHYAADITRTIPVSGRFDDRQKQLYNLVLGAQEAAIRAVKPGMRLAGHGADNLTQIARDYLRSHGQGLADKPLDEYFPHLVGHHVGLEVHDPGEAGTELQPGMVITIEPGLYFPEEGIGIRIEDMLLVTAEGSRLLSEGLPREITEIEGRMGKQ